MVEKAKALNLSDMWEEKPAQSPAQSDVSSREQIASASDPQLVVDIEGYEGPLDLMLAMARNQKLDLSTLSILELVEQYLKFIRDMRLLRLELAADYLVMAAWLTYLKSRLLLPPSQQGEDEPSGEELAEKLAFRLRRLEAMRDKGAVLMHRSRLGRDFFARGEPQQIAYTRQHQFDASLYELLAAYSGARERTSIKVHEVKKRDVWSLSVAREALERLIGGISDWTTLDSFILQFVENPKMRRSALASSFAATLEMVREGQMQIRQGSAYAPIELKRKANSQTNQETSF